MLSEQDMRKIEAEGRERADWLWKMASDYGIAVSAWAACDSLRGPGLKDSALVVRKAAGNLYDAIYYGRCSRRGCQNPASPASALCPAHDAARAEGEEVGGEKEEAKEEAEKFDEFTGPMEGGR